MENDKVTSLKKLREPFPPEAINVLPKPYKKDSPRSFCKICNSTHGMPAAHLSYVGHAALTDRFLEVDPMWTWEPMALSEQGLPVIDKDGGMWIKLTICGVTRLGYGDSGGKRGTNATKELIGDALRNAGMRFGCALDLWHKGDLPHNIEADDDDNKVVKPKDPANNKQQQTPQKTPVETIKAYIDSFCKPVDGKFADKSTIANGWDTYVKPILGQYSEAEQNDITATYNETIEFLKEKTGE